MYISMPVCDLNAGKAPKRNDYLWLLVFGFLGYYMASYLDFVGLLYIKASLERVILFVYPTLVLLISRIFLKNKISNWQVGAIGTTYVGIVITFVEELSMTTDDSLMLGGAFIFLSALTYAAYLVGSGWLIPKFGSVRFTAYAMIVACAFVLLHNGLLNRTDLWSFNEEVYWLALIMAIFATVIPSFLVSEAIKYIGASNFSIIGSLGPISTIVLANLFLDEKMTFLQIVGTLVVIAGVLILAQNKNKLKNEGSLNNIQR